MPKPSFGAAKPGRSGLETAVAAHQEQRLEEAERLYRTHLMAEPNDHAAHNLLGSVLFQTGRPRTGLAAIGRARDLKDDFAPYLVNAAMCHLSLGETDRARGLIDRAAPLDPKSWDVKAARLIAAIDGGEHELAEELRAAFAAGGTDAAKALALTFMAAGRRDEAIAAAAAFSAQAPRDPMARDLVNRLSSTQQLSWHLQMVRDDARNRAYRTAIETVIGPDDEVLEIGAGSGLLALMAARAGAKSVTTLEMEPVLAAAARRSVADNGFADRVRVINTVSTEAKLGQEIKNRATVLIAEMFDSLLIGEDALHTLTDAKLRLCRRDARVIPARARLYGRLVEHDRVVAGGPLDRPVEGFDLSALNTLSTGLARQVRSDRGTGRPLTDPALLFSFDFGAPVPLTGSVALDLPVLQAGRADAVQCWFELDLSAGVTFSTHPDTYDNHWWEPFLRLDGRPTVQAGETVPLTVDYARTVVWARLI